MREEESLQNLLKEYVDIELLFIKYLLDREVTLVKMGDYARNYTSLPETQKWEFARFYKKELNKDIFLWQQFLQTMELPMEEFQQKNNLDE